MSSESELNWGDDDPNDPSPRTAGILARAFSGFWGLIMLIPRKARIVMSIVLFTLVSVILLSAFQPKAEKRPIPETIVKVDVVGVSASAYPIVVNTNGTIQADTRGSLVSQIPGEIVNVSSKFKTGGSFTKGEVLIEVDQRDFLAAQSQAAAAMSQAQANYSQEQANAKQAIRDWRRLGNTGSAPDLVARKPQLAAAKAELDSMQASFETAKLNLERTKIKAPYTGRVIRRDAVLGQYVAVGTVLAEIFASEGVEVRLPLSQDEYSQLGLDALDTNTAENAFDVVLTSKLGSASYTWDAQVTRTDSTFDLSTRQIDVIATVKDPFSKDSKRPPIKIGQFVNATIKGRIVEDVFVVPNKSLREGNYVFVVKNERLERTPVVVTWQDDQNALIESGLSAGDLVVTTSLNSTLAGAKVKLSEQIGGSVVSSSSELSESGNSPELNNSPEEKASSETDSTAPLVENETVPNEPQEIIDSTSQDAVITTDPETTPTEATEQASDQSTGDGGNSASPE